MKLLSGKALEDFTGHLCDQEWGKGNWERLSYQEFIAHLSKKEEKTSFLANVGDQTRTGVARELSVSLWFGSVLSSKRYNNKRGVWCGGGQNRNPSFAPIIFKLVDRARAFVHSGRRDNCANLQNDPQLFEAWARRVGIHMKPTNFNRAAKFFSVFV
jgi:hypothetical protein